MSTEALNDLIATLGFKMGLAELRYCQNCYNSQKMNKPTINELKIIDRVFYDNSTKPASYLAASFMTNDKLVADTYADLMARRNAVKPDYSAPCSLPEMIEILPKFLNRKSNGELTLFGGKYRNAEISIGGYKKIAETGIDESDCAAGIKFKTTSVEPAVTTGNIIYAVLKSFNDSCGFENRLDAFLACNEMQKQSKKTVLVEDKSIVTALSELGFGVQLITTHFERKDGCVSPFEHFANADSGILTFFNKPESVDMLLTAQLFGLRVVPIGFVVPTGTIEGISQAGERLSLNLSFLRSLSFARAIGCEADGTTPETEYSGSSVYINVNQNRYKMNSATCGGQNYYMAGFNSVLYSYSLCIASGTDVSSSMGVYTLPLKSPDDKAMGVSAELVLGAYRAQCEFEIADEKPTVTVGEKAMLRFHTLTKTSANIPTRFVGKDTNIYYLEPLYQQNGLPDFDDIRKLHGFIKNLVSKGNVLSIRPTTDDIDGVLEQMSGSVKPIRVHLGRLTSRVGGFIVESKDDLPGILVAKTPANELDQPLQSTAFNI